MARHSSFEITERLIAARAWQELPGVVHGFSTRHVDRDEFFTRVAEGSQAILLHQVHSDHVHAVDSVPSHLLHGDALITATPRLALVVKTADCLPILLFDPAKHAAGAAHAGWRGTAARIAEKTVGAMRARFGTDPAQVRAVIGPGVQVCCYEVGEEVAQKFRAQFSYAAELLRPGVENPADIKLPRQNMAIGHAVMRNLDTVRAHLDLVEANRRQLLDAGLRPGNIITGAPCTACRTDLLYSYRREGKAAGRLYALIALR